MVDVHERPYSPQAEEGSHHARPDERPPYAIAPPEDTMGTRHIEVALSDLAFPMTREELLARAGDWRIPVTGVSFRTLREYMEGVDKDRFRSPADVAWTIEREWRHRSTMGRG